MAKVLFVNPLIREEDDPGTCRTARRCWRPSPCATAIRCRSTTPTPGGRPTRSSARSSADRWDVIALGGITTAYRSIKHLVGMAQQLAPQALVVAGGGFLTAMARDIMRLLPQVDVGVVGEALRLVSRDPPSRGRWQPGLGRGAGPGLARCRRRIMVNPEAPLLMELDTLPYPAWELFPLEEVYFKNSEFLFSRRGNAGEAAARHQCLLWLLADLPLLLPPRHRRRPADGRAGRRAGHRLHVQAQHSLPQPSLRGRPGEVRARPVRRRLHQLSRREPHDDAPVVGEDLADRDRRLWIEEGLQPQCIREGVPHDPDAVAGVHLGGTSHATSSRPTS